MQDIVKINQQDNVAVALRPLTKGETLDVEDMEKPSDKGWRLVCVDGFPLGFGKLANGRLKNKYYPGWRW